MVGKAENAEQGIRQQIRNDKGSEWTMTETDRRLTKNHISRKRVSRE